jgi:predicted DNA-binding protein
MNQPNDTAAPDLIGCTLRMPANTRERLNTLAKRELRSFNSQTLIVIDAGLAAMAAAEAAEDERQA